MYINIYLNMRRITKKKEKKKEENNIPSMKTYQMLNK